MGRTKAIKKLCRYCNKKKGVKKFAAHKCIGKDESKDYWRRWKEDYPDEHSQYPTFEAYDKALLDRKLSYHGNPFGPTDTHDPPITESDMDSLEGSESGIQEVDTGVEDIPLESGEIKDDHIQYFGSQGPVSQEVQGLTETEEKPPATGMTERLKDGLHIVKGGVDEVIKITTKNRTWMFVVQVVHTVQLFAFNAKERGTDFELSRRDKKLLCEAYQATFGDSPLAKLKVEGKGEWANHIVVAQWDVYGDFYIENLFGIFERGKQIITKGQEWKEKRKERMEQQEDPNREVVPER